MYHHRRVRQRAPIALSGQGSRPRLHKPADLLFDPAAVEAPVPGRLLVLLSRLHRAEAPAAEPVLPRGAKEPGPA